MICTKLNGSKIFFNNALSFKLIYNNYFRYNQFSSLVQRKYPSTNRTTINPNSSTSPIKNVDNFKDLGIKEALCKALRQNFNIIKPTPCQQQLIPPILSGNDVLIRDLTGSGKTFGIVLALLSKTRSASKTLTLSQSTHPSIITNLLVVPSRELAFQIESWVHLLLRDTNLPMKSIIQVAVRTVQEIEKEQLENLKKTPPLLLVGTAKRLLELVENHGLKFHGLNTLALDEADHLIKLPGKHAHLKKIINREIHPKPTELLARHILSGLNDDNNGLSRSEKVKKPQVIVSSATLNRTLRYYFKDNQLASNPIFVDMSQGSYSPPTISHHCLTVTSNNIRNLVTSLSTVEEERIQDFDENDDRMVDSVVGTIEFEQQTIQTGIIFVNHKINVPNLVKKFREYGVPAKELSSSYIPTMNKQGHSYNSLSTIESDLDNFTAKPTFAPKTTIYIAQEFTSRGIDIPNISHVFILGVPSSASEYLHMSGRTGRMGRDGKVISFIKDGQKRVMMNYITFLDLKLDIYEHVD
ncbi:P-loop containing nucleoside triphosphate hydrolase protein [Glomus cerebriforme]|uniref:P-loop containing nucleoside triphosphate hydrolase protein n=1 Tax=Glomus cerebriforme TaxID=658196 RepID=A0A397TMM1_9GLOM|nr:P-loop containing nucleoside triphosphate hydrolase protein [Glomus cerebriforme]